MNLHMNKVSKVMWGIVLVFFGAAYALKVLDIVDIDFFFKGWWTMIIIIPSFISLFADKDKTFGIVGLALGIVLLISCLGLIDIRMVLKLFVPVAIIIIGVLLIFKNSSAKDAKNENQDEQQNNANNQ